MVVEDSIVELARGEPRDGGAGRFVRWRRPSGLLTFGRYCAERFSLLAKRRRRKLGSDLSTEAVASLSGNDPDGCAIPRGSNRRATPGAPSHLPMAACISAG